MSTWVDSKLGRRTELGVLSVSISVIGDDGPYTEFDLRVYLRRGVTIGNRTSSDHLMITTFRAKSEFLAQMEAERITEKWFGKNLDSLIAGESVSPS